MLGRTIINHTHTHIDEDDFPPQVQLPYIKKRAASSSTKWSKVQQVLQEREHQLEMSSGSMQTFFEALQNLSDWIAGKLKLDLLASLPPGDVDKLNEYLQDLEVCHYSYCMVQCPILVIVF